MKKLAKNIPTHYDFPGTPIFRDTTALPFADGGKLAKRIVKKYPGMQNVYGAKGENLNIIKDPNYSAAEHGYGDIEFIHPGTGHVQYSDGYDYQSPTPDKYTAVYNPKGANKHDVFLDMMHGMRNDPEYMKLLDTFTAETKKARGKSMDHWYGVDSEKDPNLVGDGREQWDNNFIDGVLRSHLAEKGMGKHSSDVKGYKMERKDSTPEIYSAADEIYSYLKGKTKQLADGGPLHDRDIDGNLLNSTYANPLGNMYREGGPFGEDQGTFDYASSVYASQPGNYFKDGGQFQGNYSLPEDSFKQGGNNLHNSVYASSPQQYPAVYNFGGTLGNNLSTRQQMYMPLDHITRTGGSILSMSNTPEMSGEGKDLVYANGGQIYTFAGRPGAEYQKTSNGWTIRTKDTNGAFITVQDPTGKRTAVLNAQAKPLVSKSAYIDQDIKNDSGYRNATEDLQGLIKQRDSDLSYMKTPAQKAEVNKKYDKLIADATSRQNMSYNTANTAGTKQVKNIINTSNEATKIKADKIAKEKAEAEYYAAELAKNKGKVPDSKYAYLDENAAPVADNTRVDPSYLPFAQQEAKFANQAQDEEERQQEDVYRTGLAGAKGAQDKGFKNAYDYTYDPKGLKADTAQRAEGIMGYDSKGNPIFMSKAQEYKYNDEHSPWQFKPAPQMHSGAAGSADWFWTLPLAIPAAIEGLAGLGAMSIPGMSTIPGATAGNLVNSGFIANSLYNMPGNARDWYDVSQGNKDWTEAALGTGEIAAGLIGSGAGAKAALQEAEKLGLKNVITGKAPIKDLFKRDDLLNIKTAEDLAKFKAAQAEGRLGETTNRFYSSTSNPDVLNYAKGEEEVFVHAVPQTKAAAAGKSLANIKPEGAALIARQRSVPTSAVVEEMIASGKLSGQSEETLQGLREIAANPEGYWNLNSFKNNKELQSLVESPTLVNPAEHFLPRPTAGDFKLMSIGSLATLKPKLIDTQKITNEALMGLQEEGIGTHAVKHEVMANTENEHKLGGNMNFKSKGAYQNWLGYVHATGVAENTPGNQSVSIKGKTHNVQHATGGNMYANGGSFNNAGFMSLPKEVQQKIRSKSFADGGQMEAQLTEFNAGGRHEENPLGGIPQGSAPDGKLNLVEQGETKLNSENYIFSDSLKVDKDTAAEFALPKADTGKTFADLSKKLNRPNSRRENDTIEQVAIKRDLDNLMNAQEAFKQKEVQKKMEEIQALDPNALAQVAQSYQPQGMPPQGMGAEQGMPQEGMPQGAPEGQPSPEEMAMMQQQDQGQGQPPMDPAMMQQMMAQQGAPEMPMQYGGPMSYKCGGGMYDYGGHLMDNHSYKFGGAQAAQIGGQVLSTFGSLAGSIPGVGTAVGIAAGGLGKGLTEIGNQKAAGVDDIGWGEVAKKTALGAASGALGPVGAVALGAADKALETTYEDPIEKQRKKDALALSQNPNDPTLLAEAEDRAKQSATAGMINQGIGAIGGAIGNSLENNAATPVAPTATPAPAMPAMPVNDAMMMPTATTMPVPEWPETTRKYGGNMFAVGGTMPGSNFGNYPANTQTNFANNAGPMGQPLTNLYAMGGIAGEPVVDPTTPADRPKTRNILNTAYDTQLQIWQGIQDKIKADPTYHPVAAKSGHLGSLSGTSEGEDFEFWAKHDKPTQYIDVPIEYPAEPLKGNFTAVNTGQVMADRPNIDASGNPLLYNRQYSQYAEQAANAPEKIQYANRAQNVHTVDPNDPSKYITSTSQVPYSSKAPGGAWTPVEAPTNVWVNAAGERSNTQPRRTGGNLGMQDNNEFGGDLDSPTEEDMINHLTNLDINTTRSFDFGGFNTTDRDRFGNLSPYKADYDKLNESAQLQNPWEHDAGMQLPIDPIKYSSMTEAEKAKYLSDLQAADESLKDKNLNLNMNQTWAQAAGLALPAAYNIQQGLFGKVGTLNPEDYYQKADFTPYEYNDNPQRRAIENTFAGLRKDLGNMAGGGGGYGAALQAAANSRNASLGELNAQKENTNAANALDAKVRNKAIEAANKGILSNVTDYNIKAKEAKRKTLAEGLKQAADIAKGSTEMDAQSAYMKALAPDFAGSFNYNTIFDQISAARKASGKGKNNKTA